MRKAVVHIEDNTDKLRPAQDGQVIHRANLTIGTM